LHRKDACGHRYQSRQHRQGRRFRHRPPGPLIQHRLVQDWLVEQRCTEDWLIAWVIEGWVIEGRVIEDWVIEDWVIGLHGSPPAGS